MLDSRDKLLHIYRELADWYDRQRQPQMRDRFLILAADAALAFGRADEAERLRLRLLQVNPHHMLKPYASFAQAVRAADVQTYIRDLRTNYPLEVAEDLLRSLGGDPRPAPAAAPLPQTAPVLDLDLDGGRLPPPQSLEGETFFDSGEAVDLDATAAPGPAGGRGRPPAADRPPPTLPLPAARPRPAPIPRAEPAYPRRQQPLPHVLPVAAPPLPQAPEAAARPGGGWLGILLVLLVLGVGVALTVFTFARPYLPPGWLK